MIDRRLLALLLACAVASSAQAEPPPPTECNGGPGWTFIIVDSGRSVETMPSSVSDILHVRNPQCGDDSLRLGLQSCCCGAGDQTTCSTPDWGGCAPGDCPPEDGLALFGCITRRGDGRAHVPVNVTLRSTSGSGQVFLGAIDQQRLDTVVGEVVGASEGVHVLPTALDLLVGRIYHVQATVLRSVDPAAPPAGLFYVGETENYRLVVTASGTSLVAMLTPDGQTQPSSSSATCSSGAL